MFFKLWLLCLISEGLFIVLSLKGWGLSFLLVALPVPSQMIFKVLDFNSYWLEELTIFIPYGFQSQIPGGFVYPRQVPWCDSLFLSLLPRGSFPLAARATEFCFLLHLCPSYLLRCGLFSTFIYGEPVPPVFGLLFGLFTLMSTFSSYIHEKYNHEPKTVAITAWRPHDLIISQLDVKIQTLEIMGRKAMQGSM